MLVACFSAMLAIAAGAVGGPTAQAASEASQLGDVAAELSYTESDSAFSGFNLRIARSSATLYDGSVSIDPCGNGGCRPTGAFGSDLPSVQVAQLDATADPEVVLDMYTGGAHCCFVAQVWSLGPSDATPIVERGFGNPTFKIADIDGDGVSEFRSADNRFAYRFASYASSGMPLQILNYRDGGFVDVTRSFQGAIRSDAGRYWHEYQRAGRPRREKLGIIAAWVADQYRLRRRARALSVLRREMRAGRLAVREWNKHPFIGDLDGFLRRLGYNAG